MIEEDLEINKTNENTNSNFLDNSSPKISREDTIIVRRALSHI